MLLIELDGHHVQLEDDSGKIERLCRYRGTTEFRVASEKKKAENLWKARRNLSPSLPKFGSHKINQDVVVPRSGLAEFVISLSAIGRKYNLPIPSFGHAGDGNIHVNIMYNKDDRDETRRANRPLEEILKVVIDSRGTISGEHGIGITKKPYIGMEIPLPGLELMRRIKKAFAPNGILNPEKSSMRDNGFLGQIFPLDLVTVFRTYPLNLIKTLITHFIGMAL